MFLLGAACVSPGILIEDFHPQKPLLCLDIILHIVIKHGLEMLLFR